jgi:hypothetical protein
MADHLASLGSQVFYLYFSYLRSCLCSLIQLFFLFYWVSHLMLFLKLIVTQDLNSWIFISSNLFYILYYFYYSFFYNQIKILGFHKYPNILNMVLHFPFLNKNFILEIKTHTCIRK